MRDTVENLIGSPFWYYTTQGTHLQALSARFVIFSHQENPSRQCVMHFEPLVRSEYGVRALSEPYIPPKQFDAPNIQGCNL